MGVESTLLITNCVSIGMILAKFVNRFVLKLITLVSLINWMDKVRTSQLSPYGNEKRSILWIPQSINTDY